MTRPIEMEFKQFKLIAREWDNGWQIQILPAANSGQATETMTYAELGDALDEAKRIVNERTSS